MYHLASRISHTLTKKNLGAPWGHVCFFGSDSRTWFYNFQIAAMVIFTQRMTSIFARTTIFYFQIQRKRSRFGA